MDRVREPCRAKLNLFLDVTGRRADGFHELVTIFHEIDAADDLDAARAPEGGISLEVDGGAPDVPRDGSNLAARAAAALLAHHGRSDGVSLRLVKRLPSGAGLGGGSADAAGALRAVDRLLALGTREADLLRIAASLGSDVAFLLRGGSAIGRGRGETLSPVAARPLRFAVIVPAFPVATAAAYRALPRELPAPVPPDEALAALAAGDPAAVARHAHNALLPAALAVEPRLRGVIAACERAAGPRVRMTGSGSSLFVPLSADEPLPRFDGIEAISRTFEARSAAR